MSAGNAPAIAGLKPDVARGPKGRERVAAILAAAQELLIDGGTEAFSLRNVASRAGVKLGHLQYYFRTRDDLVRAVMHDVSRQYTEKMADVLKQLGTEPAARFDAWLEFLLKDAHEARTSRLFVQLWALADSLDRSAPHSLDEIYETDVAMLANLISAMNPRLGRLERQARAAAIASMVEGTLVVLRGARQAAWLRAADEIRRAARALALAPPDAPATND